MRPGERIGIKPSIDDMLDTDEIRFVEVIDNDYVIDNGYSGFGSGALGRRLVQLRISRRPVSADRRRW